MALILISCALLIVSYVNDDGNLKFNMNFRITRANTIRFELKNTELAYGTNDDDYSAKYNDMDLNAVFNNVFDSGSLKPDITAQLVELTEIYVNDLITDITSDISIPQSQKDQLIDYLNNYTTDYASDIDEIMNDISFAADLNVSDDTNDAFRYMSIPGYLTIAGILLCVVTMLLVTLMYLDKVPEGCCCKFFTSCCCFMPALIVIIVVGAAWIVLVALRDTLGEINWDDAEDGFRNSLVDVMNQYVTDPINNWASGQGITYNGWTRVLDATIEREIRDFSDDLSVGTSPWLQCIAGVCFLIFSCSFCCCKNKKDEQEGGENIELGYGSKDNNFAM